MKKPYIVCHMMTSLDGRIDCAMTEQLPGVDDYYQTLEALQAPTTVSGRVTAQLEMALPGEFQAADWVRFSLILPYCFLAFSSVRIWASSDLLRVSLMPISCTIAPARYIQATRYRILLATSML